MDKNVEISILCQVYGKLLTEKQYEFINDYYNNDLSLSEIAENNDITRQAVRDILQKSKNKLLDCEKKIGLMKKEINNKKTIDNIFLELKKIDESISNKDIKNSLNNIKKELEKIL